MPVHSYDGPLPLSTVTRVRGLARAAADADGVAPLGEQTLLDLVDGAAPVRHLTVTAPGANLGTGPDVGPAPSVGPADDVLGYACLDLRGRPTAELVVVPAARRRGLGRALLVAVRTTALAEAGELPLVWAHGDLPAARALAARAGMTVRRELWQMTRGLTDLPDLGATPDGLVLRTFVPGQDEDALLAINAAAFAWHPEQGRMTAADLAAREREPWFRPDDLLLAERDGRLVAFSWMKVDDDDAGELYALGVDPGAQGGGLGRLLTAHTLHHLATRGVRTAMLYTEADNTAAVRTYTAAGFRRSRTDVQYG